jgi:alpha-tubulin suppressor-like RCC1 family protein
MANLFTWGNNYFGRLGNNSNESTSSPVQIGNTANWSVVSGMNSSFAIKNDGTMWSWGTNYVGILGDLTNEEKSSPVQIGLGHIWSDVKTHGYHTIAKRNDNTLWSWGSNYNGQLGDLTTGDKSSPVQVGADNDWESFAAGEGFAGAIKTDGTIWMWGYNYSGVFGNNSAEENYSSPVQIGIDTDWKKLTFGRLSCAGIKENGSLFTWGQNYNGCLGQNDSFAKSSPIQVGEDTNWKQVAVSSYNNPAYMIALKTNGTIWAWGNNAYGQLGNGESGTDISSPIQIGNNTNWKFVATGYGTSYGIKTDGSLWAWGSNGDGQFGDGTVISTSSPVQILSDKIGWTSISAQFYAMGLYTESTEVIKSCSSKACTTPAFKCYVGTTSSCTCAKWRLFSAGCTRIQASLGICSGTSSAYVPAITVCNLRLF